MRNQNSQSNKLPSVQLIAKCFMLTLAVLTALMPDSFAGTGGTQFDAAADEVTNISEGGGGRLFAISALTVASIITGFTGHYGKMIAAAVSALGFTFGPAVMGGSVSALI